MHHFDIDTHTDLAPSRTARILGIIFPNGAPSTVGEALLDCSFLLFFYAVAGALIAVGWWGTTQGLALGEAAPTFSFSGRGLVAYMPRQESPWPYFALGAIGLVGGIVLLTLALSHNLPVARLLRALGKTALFVLSPLRGLGRCIMRVCARIERARKRIADIPLG